MEFSSPLLSPEDISRCRQIGIGNRATIRRIIDEVCAEVGIAKAEIYGTNRTKIVCHARQLVMFIAHVTYGISYPEIGRWMGRDHSTVMHGVNAEKKRRGL